MMVVVVVVVVVFMVVMVCEEASLRGHGTCDLRTTQERTCCRRMSHCRVRGRDGGGVGQTVLGVPDSQHFSIFTNAFLKTPLAPRKICLQFYNAGMRKYIHTLRASTRAALRFSTCKRALAASQISGAGCSHF